METERYIPDHIYQTFWNTSLVNKPKIRSKKVLIRLHDLGKYSSGVQLSLIMFEGWSRLDLDKSGLKAFTMRKTQVAGRRGLPKEKGGYWAYGRETR